MFSVFTTFCNRESPEISWLMNRYLHAISVYLVIAIRVRCSTCKIVTTPWLWFQHKIFFTRVAHLRQMLNCGSTSLVQVWVFESTTNPQFEVQNAVNSKTANYQTCNVCGYLFAVRAWNKPPRNRLIVYRIWEYTFF